MSAAAPAATMSLTDALKRADVLDDEGRTAEAVAIWQQILAQVPDEPNSLRGLAGVLNRQGRVDDAVAALCRAIEKVPGSSAMWTELGRVLMEADRHAEGAEAMRRALEADPTSAARHNDFGVACMECGDLERAEQVLRAGLALEGERPALHLNLAQLMMMLGRPEEAAEQAANALVHEPDLGGAHKIGAQALAATGRREEAVQALHRWKQVDPGNPEIVHQLAALGAAAVPSRAADGYVQQVFDRFADSFEQRLSQLGYRAPGLIAAEVDALAAELPRQAAVLDAGCGTGLCGPLLRPHAGRLEGVDLSGGMLERAHDRGYDALHQAELTAFLQGSTAAWDLIVSADTLCYFGDLDEVLRAAAQALRGPGLLVFSVEALPDDAGLPLRLNLHGRYSHARGYVEQALAAAGFHLRSLTQQELRRELGATVQGWIVVAQRRAA